MLLGEPTPKAPEELRLAVGWCEDKLGDDPVVTFDPQRLELTKKTYPKRTPAELPGIDVFLSIYKKPGISAQVEI